MQLKLEQNWYSLFATFINQIKGKRIHVIGNVRHFSLNHLSRQNICSKKGVNLSGITRIHWGIYFHTNLTDAPDTRDKCPNLNHHCVMPRSHGHTHHHHTNPFVPSLTVQLPVGVSSACLIAFCPVCETWRDRRMEKWYLESGIWSTIGTHWNWLSCAVASVPCLSLCPRRFFFCFRPGPGNFAASPRWLPSASETRRIINFAIGCKLCVLGNWPTMPNKLDVKKSIWHLNKSNDLFIQSLTRQRGHRILNIWVSLSQPQ